MNRMTFFALGPPLVSNTSQVTRALSVAGGRLDGVLARLAERDAADPVGRMVAAVFLLDEGRGLAHDRGGVLAVDRHADVGLGRAAGELDLQVEARAGQDLGAVERIDGLRGRGGAGEDRERQPEIDREKSPHVPLPSNGFGVRVGPAHDSAATGS